MNTTVRIVNASTTVRFVDRKTTVRFPLCQGMSQAQFNVLMDGWLASLQAFDNNEDAEAVLGTSKAFKFSADSDVNSRGVIQITY